MELWNKSSASQLDAQLRERRRNFARRLEAIERIQEAASGLDERIAEIHDQENVLRELEAKLTELTSHLIESAPGKYDVRAVSSQPEKSAMRDAA